MNQCSGPIVLLALLALLGAVDPVAAQVILGDALGDGDVDWLDFGVMQRCLGGGGETPVGCEAFEFDGVPPINLSDFSYFLCAAGGPGGFRPAVAVDPTTSLTNEAEVTLTGITAGAVAVRVVGGLRTVSAATSECEFSVAVPLEPNVVNHLFVTAIFGAGIPSAPLPVTITQDQSPPSLFIDFPSVGAVITTATTDVSGRVGDMLSGFQGLLVTVNGVEADVDVGIGTNGSFFARNVPLQLGTNSLTAVAHDALGNMTQREISVDRVEVPPNAAQMRVVSGNGQTGEVYAPLPNPIVVRLTNIKRLPLAGKLVSFHVTRNDGRLAAAAIEQGAMMLQAFTDADGEARAFWHLGGTAGCGNNRVEVTSDGMVGTTVFCASGLPRPAGQINVGSGNNQRAEAGGPAPEPLRAWVNDSCNPVVNVPVTFTVISGQGKVNGQNAVTVKTGITGHAEVAFTLGVNPGNNVVRVDFPGNVNEPAFFFIYGIKRNADQPTRFRGAVYDNGGLPIEGAQCTLIVDGFGIFTTTDADGRFLLDNIAGAGQADLVVDGRTATAIGGNPISACMTVAGGSLPNPCLLPFLHYEPVIVPNADNSIPTPILLPSLNPRNRVPYHGTDDVVLTVEGVAGLAMTVAAGTRVVLPNASCVDPDDSECTGDPACTAEFGAPCVTLALNHVHHDDIPMPIPDGAAPQFAWTLQPGGATFDPPVAITYPNMSGLPPGAIAYFLSFDHDTHRFEIIASGQVSGDGMVITSDPGAGISNAGWGCNCPPYSVTGQCCHSEGAEGGGFDCCLDPCPPCTEGCDGDCAPIICVPGECSTCQDSECVPINNGMPCSGDKCEICLSGACVSTCGACTSCQNGMCAPCGPCAICVKGVCVSLGTDCGTGCCPLGMVCCGTTQGFVCVPPTSTCCNGGVCEPPNSVCCPGGCAPDGHVCCSGGEYQCATAAQCCGDGPCCAPGENCCDGQCYPAGTKCCPPGVPSCPTPEGGIRCCPSMVSPVCCAGQCLLDGTGCCADGSSCPDGVCCGTGANAFCAEPGSVCCPAGHTCGDDAPICCGDGCVVMGGGCCNGVACGQGFTGCCGNACVSAGQKCCLGDPQYVCNVGQLCCGQSCCAPDQECCDGQCYAAGTVCCPQGGACPLSQPQCCHGLCVAANATCCFGGSCPASHPVCCPPGGTLTHCGAPDTHCCGSTSCTVNQTCCIGANGSDCCNAGEACINGVCGQP